MRDNPPTRAPSGPFRRLSLLSLAALLAGAFALAGCGGSRGGAEEAAEPTATDAATDAATDETATDETTTEDEPQPMTEAERRWLNQFNRYSARVERVVFPEGRRTLTHAVMRAEVAVLEDCRPTLKRAGEPGRFAPAREKAERMCERFGRAADALEQAIAVSDPGGAVIAGGPEEKVFERALDRSREASGNGFNVLMRARDEVKSIRADIPD